IGSIRHQRCLCRPYLLNDFEVTFIRVSFYVKLSRDDVFKLNNITISYVSLVRSWVYCYALGTEAFTIGSRFEHIRIISSAGVSECSEFVNIDTEFSHAPEIFSDENYTKSG